MHSTVPHHFSKFKPSTARAREPSLEVALTTLAQMQETANYRNSTR